MKNLRCESRISCIEVTLGNDKIKSLAPGDDLVINGVAINGALINGLINKWVFLGVITPLISEVLSLGTHKWSFWAHHRHQIRAEHESILQPALGKF